MNKNDRAIYLTAYDPDEEFEFRVAVQASEIAAYGDYSALYEGVPLSLLHLKSGRSFMIKMSFDALDEAIARYIGG